MEALSDQNIINLMTQVDGLVSIHPTAISFLQQLLSPYAYGMEQQPSARDAFDWFEQRVDEAFATLIHNNLIKVTMKNTRPTSKLVANFIVEYIITEVLSAASNITSDDTVLPWDIQSVINDDHVFVEMFPSIAGTTLPVIVTVNNEKFTHMLDKTFTSGLLLFSAISGYNFYVAMFDKSLDFSYMIPTTNGPNNEYYNRQYSKYALYVKYGKYGFNTSEFIQGFITGASWAGVDHHKYWTDFTMLDGNNNVIHADF